MQHFALYERVHVLPVLDITLHAQHRRRLQLPGGRLRLAALAVRRGSPLAVGAATHRLAAAPERAHPAACCACGLALILGGALGNVIDRLRIGHVVDFILVHWGLALLSRHSTWRIRPSPSARRCCSLDAWLESRSAKRVSV